MFNFSLNRRLALTVISAAAITLVGCGGTNPTSTALTVVPALGAVYGGTVTVYGISGSTLGSGTTGSDGKVTINLAGYSAGQPISTPGEPIVVKTVLGVGSTYFNEKTGATTTAVSASDTPVTLLAIVPSVANGQSVGVTPLTNMAAAFAGVTSANAGTKAAPTAAVMYSSLAKTLLALGLPATTNITEAPIAATKAAPKGGAGTGAILAAMAEKSSVSPAEQANALAAAVTGGAITGTPSIITSVYSTIKAAESTLNITVAAPVTAPTTDQLNAAVTDVTSVAKGNIPEVKPATGTGTGSVGTGS